MELLYTPNSPYSRMVRVRILVQALDVALTPVSVRESADALLEYSPAGKVPSLKLDDGQVLSETRLICEYFDSLQPSGFLASLADIAGRCLEGVATGLLDGVAVWVRELRRDPSERVRSVLELERDRFHRCLAYFESRNLDPHRLNFASTAIASAIELVDTRIAGDWRVEHRAMCDWFERISKNTALRTTAPLQQSKPI